MPTGTLVSLEEYLGNCYEPDCDYVDDHIEKRNLGKFDHSSLQTAIAAYFGTRQKQWNITAVVEQRVQVAARRYRVPDVCVVVGKTKEQIMRDFDRDYWMDAKESVAYGIVDGSIEKL